MKKLTFRQLCCVYCIIILLCLGLVYLSTRTRSIFKSGYTNLKQTVAWTVGDLKWYADYGGDQFKSDGTILVQTPTGAGGRLFLGDGPGVTTSWSADSCGWAVTGQWQIDIQLNHQDKDDWCETFYLAGRNEIADSKTQNCSNYADGQDGNTTEINICETTWDGCKAHTTDIINFGGSDLAPKPSRNCAVGPTTPGTWMTCGARLTDKKVEIYYKLPGQDLIIQNSFTTTGTHSQQMVPYLGTWCINKVDPNTCSNKDNFTTQWKNYMFSPKTDGDLAILGVPPPPAPTEPGCYSLLPTGCDSRGGGNANKWVHDTWGEEHRNAKNNKDACIDTRKSEYNSYCDVTDTKMHWNPPPTPTAPTLSGPPKCDNWTHCAYEGQPCKFDGTKDILYRRTDGQEPNKFKLFKNKTSSVTCSNAIDGDPARGYGKECLYCPSPTPTAPTEPYTLMGESPKNLFDCGHYADKPDITWVPNITTATEQNLWGKASGASLATKLVTAKTECTKNPECKYITIQSNGRIRISPENTVTNSCNPQGADGEATAEKVATKDGWWSAADSKKKTGNYNPNPIQIWQKN